MNTKRLKLKFRTCGLNAHELKTLRRRLFICKAVKGIALGSCIIALLGAGFFILSAVAAGVFQFWGL